jgi:ACS family glucarate transporter-like MFS transporter
LGGILLVIGTIVSGTGAAVLSLSLATGFVSWCEGPFWAAAIEIAGEQVGAAAGMLNMGGNLGGFLAPLVTPYVASRFGWSWGLYAGSLMAIIGMIACYLVDPAGHRTTVRATAANVGSE